MNVIPVVPNKAITTRQLLSIVKDGVLDILDAKHKNTTNRDAYINVIAQLLSLPPSPPVHPIVFSYWPKDEFTEEEYVSINYLNISYREPRKDLKPYFWNPGDPMPAGHYNANSTDCQKVLSMTFAVWSEAIDATLWINDERCRLLLPTLEHFAAELLWELTFVSFDNSETQQQFKDVLTDIEEYKKNEQI